MLLSVQRTSRPKPSLPQRLVHDLHHLDNLLLLPLPPHELHTNRQALHCFHIIKSIPVLLRPIDHTFQKLRAMAQASSSFMTLSLESYWRHHTRYV